jgi:hypothetical protein
MEAYLSKLSLQIIMGLLPIIPVMTGLLGLLGVQDPPYVAADVPPIVLLDTNLRFYSGVWLGLGLALYWVIPRIETESDLFREIWAMIFIGGIGFLRSMTLLASPLLIRKAEPKRKPENANLPPKTLTNLWPPSGGFGRIVGSVASWRHRPQRPAEAAPKNPRTTAFCGQALCPIPSTWNVLSQHSHAVFRAAILA